MAELRTLQSRIKTLNTRRVNILKGEQRRVSGSARVSLKRHIWLRDAGVSSGVKNDRFGHRAPSHAEKKFPFQGS
ncbi:hypothetical protein ABT802_004399 [Escherichia coli]